MTMPIRALSRIILSVCAAWSLAACGRTDAPPATTDAGIMSRYEQALTLPDEAQVLAALERLTQDYAPVAGYEDAVHARYLRLAHYQILYRAATAGRDAQARAARDWLIANDADIR